MKKISSDCRGNLMLEALLALLLIGSCLGSLAYCFTSFLQGYNALLQKRELKAQMRLVLSHMLYDFEKSSALIVTQKDGCDKITFVKTTPYGAIWEKVSYEQYGESMKDSRIYKRQHPITPGYSSCPIGIRFYCQPLNASSKNKTFLLRLEGTVPALENPLTIATAVRLDGSSPEDNHHE